MHEFFMRRCLELAGQGREFVGINPMVGAVLVRDGKVIAEGFHARFGRAHAERDLLEKYEHKISTNDILYVNLEPCCHEAKKTPPCAQMLIEKGIRTVVYGMRDPNPEVAGKGIELLRAAGVQVIGPVLEAECQRFNRGFTSLKTAGRPWVTLKSARTVDGAIASSDGSLLKITSAMQDTWSHAFLRARHDAILVGIGTVISDDPALTVRCADDVRGVWRIILDPNLRIPRDATVLTDSFVHRTIVICSSEIISAASVEKRGALVLRVPHTDAGFDWIALWAALTTPKDSFCGIASILVEGGETTWKNFREAKCVDEEITLIG